MCHGLGIDAFEFLSSLGREGINLAIIEAIFYLEVLETLYLIGNNSLALYVALVLDKYFGGFDYLFAASILERSEAFGKRLNHSGKNLYCELRTQNQIVELCALLERGQPFAFEHGVDDACLD